MWPPAGVRVTEAVGVIALFLALVGAARGGALAGGTMVVISVRRIGGMAFTV